VGGTCGTHGGEQRCLQGFGWEARREERRRWEDNITLDLWEIGIDEANWIQLTQDKVQWRTFVSTLIELVVLTSN
jgi:hypothetical protein